MAYGVPWKYLWVIGTLYEREREVQLGSHSSASLEKKCLDSMSFPGKTSRTLSGKVQVTSPWCGNWRLLSKVSYINRYSAVTSHPPKHVVPVKTTHSPPWTPATIQSHCPERDVFFPEGVPLGYDVCMSEGVCVWVCAHVRRGGVHYFGVEALTTTQQLVLI